MTAAGRRLAAIFNPHSGGGGYKRDLPLIFDALRGLGYRVEETARPRSPATPARLAREAVAAGFDLVCAIGGDGTVNETINGLAGSDVPAGHHPHRHRQRAGHGARHPARAAGRGQAARVRQRQLDRPRPAPATATSASWPAWAWTPPWSPPLHPAMKKALKEAAFAVQGVGTYLTHEDPLFRVTERGADGRGLLRRVRQLVQLRRGLRHHAARRHARRPAGRLRAQGQVVRQHGLVLDGRAASTRTSSTPRSSTSAPRAPLVATVDGDQEVLVQTDGEVAGKLPHGVQGRAARPARRGAPEPRRPAGFSQQAHHLPERRAGVRLYSLRSLASRARSSSGVAMGTILKAGLSKRRSSASRPARRAGP